MITVETAGLPFGVKRITTEHIDKDTARVTVDFHWWFVPVAWFNRLRSTRVS